ncbi:MAG: serine acetyltransferase, partial [Planctomycetaceae bacterium]|nr:serine acetyltransferase [Planctomycetaceae bacterium]
MATDFRLKEQLSDLTERIVDSYQEIGTINHLGHCPLPNTQVIVDCLHDLKEVLFPGYRRRQNLHMGNVVYFVGDLIDALHDKLTDQFARALRSEHDRLHGPQCEKRKLIDFEARGQQEAIRLLES